jgi:hypothetical protein
MHKSIDRKLSELKSAIVGAQASQALILAGELEEKLAAHGVAPEDLPRLDRRLHEIRNLAEASGRGALRAIEDVRAILKASKSIQTYDRHGQRRDDPIQDAPPRRF